MTSKTKTDRAARGIAAALCCVFTCGAHAAADSFAGRWMLQIDAPGVAVPYSAQLDIEVGENGVQAFVENGPAPVELSGERIEIVIDARDRQGFRFERILTGTLEGERMSGTVRTEGILETAAEFGENGSAWSAIRASDVSRNYQDDANLNDFDGTWVGIRGADLRKYSMALTPAGQAWVDAYDARMDEPQKRCVSPGLVAAVTWIFPFELLVSDSRSRLTLLYEAFGLHRRIHMSQDELPEFYPESSMGYSRGRLVNGELIIETTLLAASTRDFNGEPVGEETRIVERYFLTNGGDRLNLVMHMYDQQNYRRPPIRRRAWNRDNEALLFPFECDPDSFFRQLYGEGRMQEYIDRAHMRP